MFFVEKYPLTTICVSFTALVVIGFALYKMDERLETASNDRLVMLTKTHPCAAERFRKRLEERPELPLTNREATAIAEQCDTVNRQLIGISKAIDN